MKKLQNFTKAFIKTDIPDIRPGDTVRVSQTIKEGDKERIQAFEGVVLSVSRKKEIGATVTIRKMVSGVGVEKIFPLNSPVIKNIEILKRGKVRRAKLYYLRNLRGKRAKIKRKEFSEVIADAESETEPESSKEEKQVLQNTDA